MAINKTSQKKSKNKQQDNHPLADVAGKFGGEFWLETQSEIENARKKDKEEMEKLIDTWSYKCRRLDEIAM